MKNLVLVFAFAACTVAGFSQNGTVMVGGETMYPKMDIVSNAANSPNHTTLVAAVKAAGLVETLQGEGSYCFSSCK